ncbi:MAG: ribonuclease III, partial [Oscillospiraceae bacterium]|nr:ribonuclease III [Oscillospiraceae bacterium]
MSVMDFEEIIGYSFNKKELLETALSHSSYANERGLKSNERLEFLGDSVLSIIVSEYLFEHLTLDDEGKLTKYRASLVCEQSLADLASDIRLGEYIRLGKGEENTGGRKRASIL